MAFHFGPWRCPWSEAFYLTKLSIAIVNQKPIRPGHCLVLSRRVVPRLADLTSEEAADLWATVHAVTPALQAHFAADALTIAVQDGVAAGQTVPHVHVHVLPRRPGDFERNDEVYEALDNRSATVGVDADEERKPRSAEDMAREALELRPLFVSRTLPIPNEAE